MNLVNRFIAIGHLTEARFDLYPTHIKAKLALDINGASLTCYARISRKFNGESYADITGLLDHLHPKVDGYVWVNDSIYYQLDEANGAPTQLMISGNISPNDAVLFFNFAYCKICQSQTSKLTIDICGQFINDQQLLNIVSDNPRVFNIERPEGVSQDALYNCEVTYNYPWIKCDGTIKCNDAPLLQVTNAVQQSGHLTRQEIDGYMMEWNMLR